MDNSSGTTLKETHKEMVRLQQLLKETNLSEEDDSMDGTPYIPPDTGINNSNSQSVVMDESDNDNESYHTNKEMSQDDNTLPGKKNGDK